MSLPDLAWQAVYARFAWGAVAVALLLSLPVLRDRRTRLAVAVLALAAMWLPGSASPAWWLGLAFQQPSGLLAMLCAASAIRRLGGPAGAPVLPVLPIPLALGLVFGGLVLYADAVGALSLGLYAWGFDPVQAPVAGIVLSVLALAAAVLGRAPWAAWAVLLALTLQAVTRLPTGNLFDALLDPLLWLWAAWRSVAALRRRPAAAASSSP